MKSGDIPTPWNEREIEAFPFPDNTPSNEREEIKTLWRRLAAGEVYIYENTNDEYVSAVSNVYFSRCFNCSKTTTWVHDRVVFPESVFGIEPVDDMPAAVRADFEEAAAIVNSSPRGAAALLRLAVQKLCAFLGEEGKNVNDDIASLVRKGLDVRIQQALDIVRVVGNNAVHPGTIDFDDDRNTATSLFGLVNLIVDVLITQPAHIRQVYEALPPGALAAIERRDGA